MAWVTGRKVDVAVRIAMWSGPRNISTALMRSFESRGDCFVSDEPLYAHYLSVTGAEHPAREQVIAAHDPDWRRVAGFLTGPVPRGRGAWYQKHMAHHLHGIGDGAGGESDREWILGLTNALLIRDPEEMITSYIKVMPNPRPEDLGLPQQVGLFEWLASRTGRRPVVVDSRDVLEDPRGVLAALCDRLGIGFEERMLRWEPGPRTTDGVWGPHWYSAVYGSTGFGPYSSKGERVPARLAGVLEECRGLYARLAAGRIRAG